ITLSRHRVLGDALLERLKLSNYGRRDRSVRITVQFEADFLDVFEVRGMEREARGQVQEPRVSNNAVTLSYRGLDGMVRSTTLRFSPQPSELTASTAEFAFTVGPKEAVEIGIEVLPQVGSVAAPRRSLEDMRG